MSGPDPKAIRADPSVLAYAADRPAPTAGRSSPFSQRSFRFQWPADLAVSWAFEMETLVLGWYVLIETGSVVWLTAFGSLQFTGTLISPLFGVAGDRLGHRTVLSAMRAAYVLLSLCLAVLALTGQLNPLAVFVVAAFSGLVRPSDIGVRNALIAATVPPAQLAGAIGVERVSMDSARVIGALSGAALVAALGMGPAYVVVVGLYLTSLLLTFGIREPARPGEARAKASLLSTWRELGEGVAYARATPALLAALWLACLANFAAYPLSGGLLPHVARDVYGLDRTGLGTLVACFAGGALLGSLLLSLRGVGARPARVMLLAAGLWFAVLLAFAQAETALAGMVLLLLAGFIQSFCMVPMQVLLLRITAAGLRGRVMGLRMLAIYGLPVGLLLAGFGIARLGFAATATLYAGFGLLATAAIAWRWRAALWRMGEAR
ncbi:MFS transporter [Siccirubricoccus deserti]|uniref:MFS transporter n=1 Tax=Siccirubricoccus deserti TaxID=2013562 RepID=A0A9X0UE68_9PROT|nr:MFS transporter [Siccirubricoccus deserti]MBC4016423.1 MFS transporter [Siccirubricoccus deserti]GGC49133.1 MFS transporter [Siccirubricoccus deserti]